MFKRLLISLLLLIPIAVVIHQNGNLIDSSVDWSLRGKHINTRVYWWLIKLCLFRFIRPSICIWRRRISSSRWQCWCFRGWRRCKCWRSSWTRCWCGQNRRRRNWRGHWNCPAETITRCWYIFLVYKTSWLGTW